MSHVFVSYVSENSKLAAWIVSQLKLNGLDPWFSKDLGRIKAGDDWRAVLRSAIQDGGYYVPIFTKDWAARNRSVANQELMLAAEEARMRPPGRRWIIPIKVDAEPLPPIDLGGGRQLSDIHYLDVEAIGWENALREMLSVLDIVEPKIDRGEPLAPGFGTNAEVIDGFVTYRNLSIPIPELEGTIFTVTGGYVTRAENGKMIANFKLRAPFEQLQQLNEELGLDSIDVASEQKSISTDPNSPTHFYFLDKKDRRGPGSPVWRIGMTEPLVTAVAVDQTTGYDATGFLNSENQVIGRFDGFIETSSALGNIKVTFDGDFCLKLVDVVSAPY